METILNVFYWKMCVMIILTAQKEQIRKYVILAQNINSNVLILLFALAKGLYVMVRQIAPLGMMN